MARTPRLSLSTTFAALSLLTIAVITTVQAGVQWALLRHDLLERESVATGQAVRADADGTLRPEDFAAWQSPEATARFERFARRALLNPDVRRVKIYNADMRVVWSDEARLIGERFADNERLARALQGETVVHLAHGRQSENMYDVDLAEAVEVYVPLVLSGRTPGTARIAAVVEVYKDRSLAAASISRGQRTIIGTSVAGAVVLFLTLFGLVRRASTRLARQAHDLARQTEALATADRELRATQEQLRQRERLAAIGEVSAAVAHGIRNPLANIRASAQVAMDTGVGGRHLDRIISETDRLNRWLHSLLDMVRPFKVRLAPVGINALVTDVTELLRERAVAAGVTMEVALSPGAPTLLGDDVQLQQAVLSVIENALDALPRGGMLSVRTERAAGDTVAIIVEDNGPGIPAEERAHVFEPFYTTKSRGTGLGLAITHKVVEGHRGTVTVEPRSPAGTRVRIVLPVSPAVEEAV
jgi:two-component system, NtrC family, sensor histidine kinase HydH